MPTDVAIAYEVLKGALELATYGIEVGMFCYLVYNKIKENFKRKRHNDNPNIIHNEMLKVIKKITTDCRTSKIILERYQSLSLSINKRASIIRREKGVISPVVLVVD